MISFRISVSEYMFEREMKFCHLLRVIINSEFFSFTKSNWKEVRTTDRDFFFFFLLHLLMTESQISLYWLFPAMKSFPNLCSLKCKPPRMNCLHLCIWTSFILDILLCTNEEKSWIAIHRAVDRQLLLCLQ